MEELTIIGDTFTYMGVTWQESRKVLYDLRTANTCSSEYYGICTDIDVETIYTLPWKVGGTFLSYYILDREHAYNLNIFLRGSEKWE